MKLDDILQADNTTTAMLDPALLKALGVFGFVGVTYQLYQSSSGVYSYVGVIEGTRQDGSSMTWTGTGNSPDEAQDSVVDALAKWILNQPIPYYPTNHTGPGATP